MPGDVTGRCGDGCGAGVGGERRRGAEAMNRTDASHDLGGGEGPRKFFGGVGGRVAASG
jgi:hypothetical protein